MFQLSRWITAAIVVSAGIVCAQNTGRLTGTVTDQSGGVVTAARVQLWLPGGNTAVLETSSTDAGLFAFTSVRADYYDLVVEAQGFRKLTLHRVKVDPGREVVVGQVRLEVGTVTETVEVVADAPGVQTTTADVSLTVGNTQLLKLPLFDRNPFEIIKTQAGVTNSSGLTVINGMRTSFGNVTIDGINVQDNMIRANGLDFLPNQPLTDQISELTVITSNADASYGGGAAQIAMITKSGSNEFHGKLLWQNRNNKFGANGWFANKDGVEKGFLNQNQAGGSLGGYIVRNRLLFYANYEAIRRSQTDLTNRTILTEEARRGIFTYRDAAGNVRKANVLQLRGVTADPTVQQLLTQVPGPERINNFRAGDSTASLLRNTGGYSFNIRDNRTRDNTTGKLDFLLSPRHTIATSYLYSRDIVDRPDDSNDYSAIPKVRNDDARHLYSASWRWAPSARFTNELRGGFNLSPANFVSTQEFPAMFLTGFIFSNPVNLSQPESRQTNTFNLQINSSFEIARHNLRFGYQAQVVRTRLTGEAGTIPTYFIGMGLGNPALAATQLPGINATDLDRANSLLASLAGYISDYEQVFNVTSRTSGFVPGAPLIRRLEMDNHSFYVQDNWRIQPRVSVSLGMRWDYRPPVNERDALALMPIIFGNDPVQTLQSNAIFDFAGKAVNRPWYQSDRNNFAPNVSVAWDVFGTGKTALRAGYSMHYVNDEDLFSLYNNLINTNGGLQATSADFELTARISTGLPRIPVPRYRVPRTQAENQADNPATAMGLPDPGLSTPYVQQWNIGVQHEWNKTIFDLRYVGNHGTKMWRSFDFNQVIIRENGFLDDFNRARRNADLSLAARGVYDPRYNPNVNGSQPLTVFPRLEGGGLLTNPIVGQYILTGQPAELAATYFVNFLEGDVTFFRNPFSLGTNMLTSYSNSTYNALQFDVRRPIKGDSFFQANYTYGKVLSDSAGTSEVRFEPFLDLGNPQIERARAVYDLTHEIKGNWNIELPFGRGRRLNAPRLDKVIGGWQIGGLVSYRSGAPFSILSGRGTLNRTARSFGNTAVSNLTKDQIEDLFAVRMTGDGPYFVAASAISPDGTAVAADGRPAFNGQAFFHPAPGQIGTLQRRMFSGPWVFDCDLSARKITLIGERHRLQFEAIALSVFNNQAFFIGNQSLDSVNFGRVSGTVTAPRTMQFSILYQF
jgi:hypothetical protein